MSSPSEGTFVTLPGIREVLPEHFPPSTNDPEYASRRYVCSTCGKRFRRPSSLQTHDNSHTGNKPFVCPYVGCGKRFTVRSNMKRHALVHENSEAALGPTIFISENTALGNQPDSTTLDVYPPATAVGSLWPRGPVPPGNTAPTPGTQCATHSGYGGRR